MNTLTIDLDDIGMGLEEFYMVMEMDNIPNIIIEGRIYIFPENMFEAIELLSKLQQYYIFFPTFKNNNIHLELLNI